MTDIYSKFTTHFKKSILSAYGLSLAEKKQEIGIEELFWALLAEKGSLGQETLIKVGVKKQNKINSQLADDKINLAKVLESRETIPLSEEAKQAIIDSTKVSVKFEHSYVGTEHLLYSLINLNHQKINMILAEYKIKHHDLVENLEIILNSTAKFSSMAEAVSKAKERMLENKKDQGKKDSVLDFFGSNLTDWAIQQNIHPVIGRQDEINRVVQILCRRDKNNPILLGEPGVGKTAIVEGLAKKILAGDVPEILTHKKIYALDMPLLVAGTSFRGEFEGRVKQIVDEVKTNKNIILFIDEIHNIMGAGSLSGAMDAANILKPALARGEIRCIGATTYDDFKKFIEPDAALSRRMQKVAVNEPSMEESVKILKGIKDSYEKHHLVTIGDEAIEEAVNLSARYITEQYLPDKAIDLIDEAGSKKRINRPKNKSAQQLAKLEKEMGEIQQEKKKLVNRGEYNQALRLKSKEIELVNRIYQLEETEIKNKMKADTRIGRDDKITAKDIRQLMAETTKISLPDTQQTNQIIKNLTINLKKEIIGQDRVIKELTNTLKRSAAGLSGGQRPLGSFIFAGPSGVGKTYTAKTLAKLITPTEQGLIKLDMSEFGESFNSTKLIGAPAGYVGYQEGGQLTEKVKRNPYAVILLDEIEKAHPDIFNLFLQIFEDGYLTDSKGRRVNFRNTIIIMTTNIGLKKSSAKESIGFGDELKTEFKEKLADWMRPELLNRIDQILIFDPLSQKKIAKIIELELKNIKCDLKWNKSVVNYLLKKCGEQDRGARIIRDALREEIENPLAEIILNGRNKSAINLRIKDGKIIFE